MSITRKISSISFMIAILLTGCIQQQWYDNGTPDETYILVAKATHEAQTFLALFPNAEINVDRSGRLAVDFRLDKWPIIDSTKNWEGIRLRVFINPKNNHPQEMFIQCNTKMIQRDIIQNIKIYAARQNCP